MSVTEEKDSNPSIWYHGQAICARKLQRLQINSFSREQLFSILPTL